MTSSIDLNTILKASLELAHETDLNILLRRLISILIENAGAQRGALILLRDDQWFLEVLGSIEPEDDFRLPSIPLENQDKLVGEPCVPISLIYFVINAQQNLLLEDASVSYQFSQDTYIEKRRPKSILCSPLLNQGELYGVVYLENNLTAGTFTSDRLEVVKLIAGQAAVSIENARLYENMEALVEERTHALSEANKLLQEEIEERARAEEALRLSEERYRTVFESTGTAMAVIDENGYILLANEKYVQLSGYSRTELENHFHSRELVAPTDLHRDQDLRQAAFAHTAGIPNSFEFQMINKTGEEKAVLATTSYLPRSKAIIASLIDISQRKSAEEAVRYNEALLRKVLEILPVGVWIINENSMIISGNPEGERIWGGIKFFKMQEYGEYRAWRADTGERIQAEDWAARLALTDLQVTLSGMEIEAFDGTRRTILNSAIPLVLEEDGLVGAISVNQDITRRKQNEEELHKAHARLSTLLDVSQLIVSTLDLDLLLNTIIEQLGKVLPFEGAAILILDQDVLEFRLVRGPAIFQSLLKFQISANEQTLIEPIIHSRELFYIPDLQTDDALFKEVLDVIDFPHSPATFFRSLLGQPLITKDDLVGILVLANSQPDAYPQQSQIILQAFANQVAIAIQNAQLYKQAQDMAALEENRLARELHDSVAQALYSIRLYTDAMRRALASNKMDVVTAHLGELHKLSREAMSDMRLLIFQLRPPQLENEGLAAALQARLEMVEARAGFYARVDLEGEFSLTPEQESELYRIAQEALNNVLKHAQADHVRILLEGIEGGLRMIIEDNGVGFDPELAVEAGGQGLRNIRERAAKIGAVCKFDSAPGKGAKICIEVNE